MHEAAKVPLTNSLCSQVVRDNGLGERGYLLLVISDAGTFSTELVI